MCSGYKLGCLTFFGALLITGCHKQAKIHSEIGICPTNIIAGAHIHFEATDCNLSSIGPNTSHLCVYKFQNTGTSPLEIKDVKRLRKCSGYELSGRTFKPGEAGTLQLWYYADSRLGAINEDVHIITSDRA